MFTYISIISHHNFNLNMNECKENMKGDKIIQNNHRSWNKVTSYSTVLN